MSESTAKATRQQIRKAFGPEATGVLSTLSESSRNLGDNLNDLRTATSRVHVDHSFRLRLVEARLTTLEALPPIQAQTVWQRLRWLVTGR